MKRFLLSFSCAAIAMIAVLVIAQDVYAIDLGKNFLNTSAVIAGYDPGDASQTAIASRLGAGVQAALSFVGIIFTALIVYAGILWMTARGEDSQVQKAQTIVKAAVIGLVLTMSAYSVTAFVLPAVLSNTDAPNGATQNRVIGCCYQCDPSDQFFYGGDYSQCDIVGQYPVEDPNSSENCLAVNRVTRRYDVIPSAQCQ